MTHDIREKKITLREFLLYHTQCYELCVIRLNGWTVATGWIDDEDLFIGYVNGELLDKIVLEDNWEALTVVNSRGLKQRIEAHVIEI